MATNVQRDEALASLKEDQARVSNELVELKKIVEKVRQQVTKLAARFHVLLDFDEGKRSWRRKLEKHNRRRRRKPTDSNSPAEKENLSHTKSPEDVFPDTDQIQETPTRFACKAVNNGESNNVIDRQWFLDCDNGNGFPGCSFTGLELAQTNNPLSFAASTDARVDDQKDQPKSAFSSTICDNNTSYSSVCPTGRISFNLYDWNPVEFPRRLRHQIFHWLASMPVELEEVAQVLLEYEKLGMLSRSESSCLTVIL